MKAGTDRADFERCFREHYASVLAFALRRIADRGAAEDVAAETFAVAWRRRDRLPEAALPWLYGIALRLLANQYRSARRRRNLDERLSLEAGVEGTAPDVAAALARREAFFAAFAQLEEAEREVLRLIAWEGLDTRDAAATLGCSPGAFRVRLHRARRKLAKQLEASGHIAGEPRRTAPEPAKETN